jgi:hypothetical protein
LRAITKYVGDGIQKRMDLILEIWDLAQRATNFAAIITNFKEYLQKDLYNDEYFYKDGKYSARVFVIPQNFKL